MTIDPFDRELITLRELGGMINKSVETIRYWCYHGLRDCDSQLIRLETIKVGIVQKTTRKAYRQFIERLSRRREED